MTKIYFYKIYLKTNPEEFYIGSCLNISKRKSQHKKNTTNKSNKAYWRNLYFFIRLKGGWEQMSMEQIDELECINKEDRKRREQELIDILKPTLNSINAKAYRIIN